MPLFLLPCPGMPPNALENGIGEQRDGRGINDAKLFYPFFRTIASAVRGKNVFIDIIQIAVYLFKETLRASGIRVRQGAAPGNSFDSDMMQLSHLRRHGGLYLSQRVEPLYHGIEHRQQVGEAVKTLYILLSAVFPADFNYFFAVKRFYQLSIYRLSEKITTFTHG